MNDNRTDAMSEADRVAFAVAVFDDPGYIDRVTAETRKALLEAA